MRLIEEESAAIALGQVATLQASLRRHLIAAIDAYVEDHEIDGEMQAHVEAARRLQAAAFEVVFALEAGEPPASAALSALRETWQGFRAEGASSAIYHDQPELSRKNSASAQAPRKVYVHRATKQPLTADLLRDLLLQWTASRRQKKAFWLSIEEDFGVSESTQRRMLKDG